MAAKLFRFNVDNALVDDINCIRHVKDIMTEENVELALLGFAISTGVDGRFDEGDLYPRRRIGGEDLDFDPSRLSSHG